ncbi:asparaginase [Vogesella indigofera]|uniref:asparaginase n=1 Tax=Vogesella indigofera TaxID=45465 RepID=UPI00234F7499|nr:asparaginase [Vogesella indigofera]MDC7711388.1 asparaginase [Vogesella indigofera]
MKRLLILYTGGTIGMDHTPEGLAPVPGFLPQQLARLARDGVSWEVREYAPLLDSSAITLADWQRLVADIAANHDAFDGFVVIHGTDTMAYTASVLAFCLQGLAKPVVVTGSQLPLVHPRSDGWGNLADAIEAACQSELHEVAISFNRLLLRGVRARKLDAASFAGFDSPNAPPLAQFGIQPQWHRAGWRQASGPFRPQLPASPDIRCGMLLPGAMAAAFGRWLAQDTPDAAILLSYGNGNTPADAELLAGVQAASARGCVVLNLTQCVRGAVAVGAYAASQPLAQAGAVAGGDMTPEAAQAKLLWLLSQQLNPAEIRARLAEDCRGELTPAA